jgi:nicotinamide phosphoribosyltransferase
MNNIAPLSHIDWYKADHRRQYPNGTSLVFSNFTPRSSRIDGVDAVVFFGLQYFIKEYLVRQWNESFFSRPVEEVVARYKRRVDNALGKDAVPMDHIRELHALGYLPIRILALPEGTRVPIGCPPVVIHSTHESGFWLPNYLETILSCTLWQACTSATIAREYRNEFVRAAQDTAPEAVGFTMFQGHDFSFRGMSSLESACLSGAGHLLSFAGTDTVPAIEFLEQYYHADSDKELVGVSVPATEHSVMCMGTQDGEIETFRRLFALYPTGILSVVSDTWDYWGVLTTILPQLKGEIMARNGKLVIRPDSSPKTPLEIICGDPDAPEGSPEHKGSIQVLWELFGGTVNAAGYRELDSHIGLIYGDSITLLLAHRINERLQEKGFASTNWVAGIGSYTYQFNTRDTFGFAMKATYGVVNNEPREIFKDPKTNKGAFSKKSAKGLIAVYADAAGVRMVQQASWDQVNNCSFKVVFEDGREGFQNTLADIRNRVTQ